MVIGLAVLGARRGPLDLVVVGAAAMAAVAAATMAVQASRRPAPDDRPRGRP